jgi:hypothetical protein
VINFRLQYCGKQQCEVSGNIYFVDGYGRKCGHQLPSRMFSEIQNKTEIISKWSIDGTLQSCHLKKSESVIFNINIKVDKIFNNMLIEDDHRSFDSSLSSDLMDMLQPDTSFMSDVRITLNDQTSLNAHKLILCARSPVFKTMLSSGLAETTSNEIAITDFEPAVVRAFVGHLYFDNPNSGQGLLSEDTANLYKLAHRYEVKSLFVLCEKELINSLTVENAVDRLLLADLHSSILMKNIVIRFISQNSVEILRSENSTFFERVSGDLLQDVVKELVEKKM